MKNFGNPIKSLTFAPAKKLKVITNCLAKNGYMPTITLYGEMAEWSNAPVLKTGVLRGTGGSNPSLSAKLADFQRVFFYTQLNTQKLGYHQAL